MKLTEIQPMEKWIDLEKKIREKCQLQSVTFNIEGARITDYVKWANRLCPAIKGSEKGGPFICAVAHMNMTAQARKTRKPVIEECDAGILKIVVPIFVKDEFVGTAGGCGRLPYGGSVDSFMINKTTGIDQKEIEDLSDDIGSMTMETARECAVFVEQELEKIVQAFETGQN